MDWREQALCVDNTDLFFSGKDRDIERALRICNKCTVIHECLQEAISKPEQYGIWGGMTEDERYRESIRASMGLRQGSLRRNKLHEQRRLASVDSSSPLRIAFPTNHTQVVSLTVVALRVSFGS